MALAQCCQLCRHQQALIPLLTGRLLFFFLLSAVIQLDDQPLGLVVLGVSLGGSKGSGLPVLQEPLVSKPGEIGWLPLAGLPWMPPCCVCIPQALPR